MSETKRRDITLGEMQDECKMVNCDCKKCGAEIKAVCNAFFDDERCMLPPRRWNLTDPPRFNEAQMALLRALYGLDFVSIKNLGSGAFKTTSKDGKTGMFMEQLGIGENETLDLAELLEKDGTHAQT